MALDLRLADAVTVPNTFLIIMPPSSSNKQSKPLAYYAGRNDHSNHDERTRPEFPNYNRTHSQWENSDTVFWNATIPRIVGSSCRSLLGFTLALYILNQKALLPQPLSAVVSRVLFWPTLPITAVRRLWVGKWITVIDDTVIMGGAPFAFLGWPGRLRHQYGVHGVINMCDEYQGPIQDYERLGMAHLYLPTFDHFIPSIEHLEQAVGFLKKHKEEGKKVYVHCRAGHGRSAAAVFAWLLYNNPQVNRQELNQQFCHLRNVKSNLWKQPNIIEFHERMLHGQHTCKTE
jgi:atypical dual specificity phosphatase